MYIWDSCQLYSSQNEKFLKAVEKIETHFYV
jgi:hypothetical protein